jgi:DNA-binding NtrC family response regulator
VESALFGHEKGAFTGAIKRVEGAFERANRGTLLLDEISEMRLDLQAKLLRVLQEQEFERVGGTSTIRVDVRIIATTNRDLAAEAARGAFRQDLYYRLSTIPIAIPPLRDRKDDIPALAYRFAIRIGAEMGKEVKAISEEGLDVLQRYDWPGNVRELQHVVERAVILSSDPVVPAHAFEGLRFGLANALAGPVSAAQHALIAAGLVPIPDDDRDDGVLVRLTSLNVEEAESMMIQKALEMSGNNRTKAAELLGMSVRTLRNKLNAPTSGEASLTL